MRSIQGSWKSSSLLAASLLVLAACGGSEPQQSAPEAAAPEAAEESVETAEAASEEVADETAEAAEDAADAVEEAATEVEEAANEAVEEAIEAAEDVAEAVTPAADTGVSDEIVAQYAALTGDAAQGRRVFTKCMSCHVVQEGQNRVGPSLYGIIGRDAGSVEGFRYSDANANSGITWTEETMFAYLEQPQRFIPGTIMAFPGLPNPQERADVIAYLKAESS